MLRPMVATTAVTAALLLVAGCGGNDKKSDSGSGDNGGSSTSSPTPSAPAVPTFDPPKGFAIGAAYPVIKDQTVVSLADTEMAIIGKVAVAGTIKSLAGHDVTDPSKSWSVPAAQAATTKVNTALRAKAVKVDGKDVAVVVYSQTDKGNGTQKPQGLVVIQWIDVATGDKIAETSTKTAFEDAPIGSVAYDVESGQVAVGTAGPVSGGNSQYVTVYADPATKKSTLVPGIAPAAVHGGVIAGTKAPKSTNTNDAALALADGPSGKITKQVGPLQTNYQSIAGTAKHAYFYGDKYISYDAGYQIAIYAVDLSTGAVAVTPLPGLKSSTDMTGWTCFADEATSVACTGKMKQGSNGTDTMMGFDDTTGKKAWSFSNGSGNRIVPGLTAAYHGVLYAQTEAQPVLLDAKTGADLPSPTPSGSPSSSDTPSSGSTPSDGSSPTAGDTPSSGDTPSDGGSPGNGDLGLWNGTARSPESVSPYGGVYRQLPQGDYSVTNELDSVCVFLKATS
ncbi:hypothetical protein [Kribbella sp. NPDC004536]|uniref:hypothetical protein n=1 Tax=Kribbella sp. NPDC004536 TaxID=3364106 RepID=UPI0036C6D756